MNVSAVNWVFQMFKYIKYFPLSPLGNIGMFLRKYDTSTFISSLRFNPLGLLSFICLIMTYLFVQISFESFFFNI